MPLDSEQLSATLAGISKDLPTRRRYVVAFSGGLDSAVLLSAMAQLDDGIPLVALHINHGLHPESSRWAEDAQAFATGMGVTCEVVAVKVTENNLRFSTA